MSKYKCPLCNQDLEHPISISDRFKIFGLTIEQIKKALDFARQHGIDLRKIPKEVK
jgi:uncharacterized protein (DUF433 family)